MFGRRPRTLLDLVLYPMSLAEFNTSKRTRNLLMTRERSLKVVDEVYIKKFPNSKEQLPGKIV